MGNYKIMVEQGSFKPHGTSMSDKHKLYVSNKYNETMRPIINCGVVKSEDFQ